jgi:hypothetical protein
LRAAEGPACERRNTLIRESVEVNR